MLLLGNRHESFPLLVLRDPVLEPVDKVVWMTITTQTREIGEHAPFPSYETIARTVNVASSSTIARAIAILRLTRWLTLCARVRDDAGRFKGNLYALHDEPLTLADTLHLDPEHMEFVRGALEHNHARVRLVAAGVLESIDERIAAGTDVCTPEHALGRRLEAASAIRADGPRQYFSFSAQVMGRLRNAAAQDDVNCHQHHASEHDGDRLRISKLENSKAVRSSSYLKTTTTDQESNESRETDFIALDYPSRLSANQRELAARYLDALPAGERQAVLDELEGRFRAEKQGAKLVHDAIRYLHQLCQIAKQGELVPNLGLRVREERERRIAEAARHRTEREAARRGEGKEQRSRNREVGRAHLAKARKMLHWRGASRTGEVEN